jgi:general secretion pathway protein L
MSILRVLLDAAPAAGRADAWALFDENGRVVQSGRSAPETWPAAAHREAVLAAACVRIVGLRLPPLSADRVAAAASFALEDQLAGPAAEQHIAVSSQHRDGTIEATIANRRLVAKLADNFDRVVAEPALAPCPPPRQWCWYASGAGGGFVRKPDGSTFATSEQGGVPAELLLALDHASRGSSSPAEVKTAFVPDAATQAACAHHVGTAFVPTAAWSWDAAGIAAFAAAPDLRQGEFAPAAPNVVRGYSRLFRWAATLAALALCVHVAATLGEWLSLRVEDWRAKSALASLARDAGYVGAEDPAMAISRGHTEARHRAGLAAPADALPLLARAAPAFAALPAGVLKSATYVGGHWTFDLATAEASSTARLEGQLASAGLTSLLATNANGARVRVSLGPGAQ